MGSEFNFSRSECRVQYFANTRLLALTKERVLQQKCRAFLFKTIPVALCLFSLYFLFEELLFLLIPF
jgi:hypothetical protein